MKGEVVPMCRLNATLVINDSEKFQEDIWKTHEDWNEEKWKTSLKYQAETLQKLYEELSSTEEYCGGCEELYALGDVINMLNSIGVKKK